MQLILASTSPARRAVLAAAGISPLCFAPQVDEESAVAEREQQLGRPLTVHETTLLLGRLKAEDVVRRHGPAGAGDFTSGLVLGGDSMFELAGRVQGKPHLPEIAEQRARAHRGQTGVLASGHWLVAVDEAAGAGSASAFPAVGAVDTATVTLAADVTDEEIAAYVSTGEPLELAGGFAIDGLAGAFIERIEGAPSCVIGLSLPTLRRLVRELGYNYTELWQR